MVSSGPASDEKCWEMGGFSMLQKVMGSLAKMDVFKQSDEKWWEQVWF